MSIGLLSSGVDNFHEAGCDALLLRAGMQVARPAPGAAELRYASLIDLAAESFRARGARNLRHDRDTIARAALGSPEDLQILGVDGYPTPGDFPNILSAAARKALDAAPPYASSTFRNWAAQRPSIPDFKPASLNRVGEFGEFPLHVDGDDFEQSTVAEDQSWIQVDSYGHEFGFTPKMMVDDDLGALFSALDDNKEAHDQTLNRLCVNLLTSNVAASDGVALFNLASHSNDRTAGAAPSTAELSAMRILLRGQTGVSGKRKLNFSLYALLIPEALETVTQQLLQASLEIHPIVETATPVFKGQVSYYVEPMLTDSSAVRYFGFANPALARSIVYAYQLGYENMKTRNYYQPKSNCRIFQFEGRFAAGVNNIRGVVRNAGTGA